MLVAAYTAVVHCDSHGMASTPTRAAVKISSSQPQNNGQVAVSQSQWKSPKLTQIIASEDGYVVTFLRYEIAMHSMKEAYGMQSRRRLGMSASEVPIRRLA